jgi:Tfp pilus assembly protein PilF
VGSVPLAQGDLSPPALDRPSPVRTAGGEASGLIDLWNLRRSQLARGDVLAADQAEEDLRSLRRRNGVRRAQEVAGAFVLEGYEELALQHFTEARESFHLALEFDPDMPRAHLGLAATEWTSGGGMLITGRAYMDAGRAAARNWLYRAIGVQLATWIGLLGLPVAFAAIYLLLFLRTFPLVHHGLAELFARRLPSTTARTLAALVPLLPLALPWGVAWTPLLWLTLASPHFSRRERVVASAGLLLIAACGILLLPAARFTALSTDPRLIHVAGAARGAIGAERGRTLAELVEKSPDDAVLQFLYADQARGLGDYAKAIRAYQRAAELDPMLRPAHNNLGTLYFSLGQYATAVREFRRAMEADPQDMTAHYNLYLTQEQRFDFAAAEATLSTAQSMDMERMTALLSERDRRQGRLDVLEDTVPVTVALQHAYEGAGIESLLADRSQWLHASWPFILFPVLTLGLMRFTRGGESHPMQCPSCGRIACRLCALNLDQEKTCASCISLATRSTALPRRAREQKRLEIAAHLRRQKRSCRFYAAVIPGGGQIWSGRIVTGTLLLVLATFGGAALLLRHALPVMSYSPIATGALPLQVAALTMIVAAWLLGLLLPRAPRAGAGPRR